MIKRLKARFALPYLIFLSILLLIVGTMLAVSVHMMQDELVHKNDLLLDYVKSVFDTELSSISRLAYEISSNEWLLNYSQENEMTISDAVRITRYLDVLCNSSTIINDICIYFPKQDILVNNVGRFLPRHYYLLTRYYDPESYAQFMNRMEQSYSLEYQLEDLLDISKQPEQRITLYHSMSKSKNQGDAPLLMISLDKKAIETMMDTTQMDGSELFAILAPSGDEVACFGNEDLLPAVSVERDGKKKTTFSNDNRLVFAYAQSNYMGMWYVSIWEKSSFLGALDNVRTILIVGLVCVALMGIAGAIYFAGVNARPLHKISKVMQNGDAALENKDVYAYIEGNIRRIIRENNTVYTRLEKQRVALRSMFVAQLIRGEISGEKQFLEHCTSCGIDFSNMRHCAFILYIRSVPAQLERNRHGDGKDSLALLLQQAVRALSGAPDCECDAELTHIDNFYAGWLMLPDREDAQEQCLKYLNQLTKYLTANYTIAALAVSGGIYDSFHQIPDSYEEALQLLNIAVARNLNRNITFGEIENDLALTSATNMDCYGLFVNCLRAQDFEGARRQLDSLLENYLNIYLPNAVYALRKHAVLSVMLDALDWGAVQSGCVEEAEGARLRLQAAVLPDVLSDEIHEAICVLQAMREKCRKENVQKNFEQIRAYIDENFTNPDMGLTLLTQRFEMSSAYLSKFIKAELGVGILDYVNKKRVEEAKRLLTESEMNVNKIAEAVGYISDITFIRVFKRYEGMTPGKYREMGGK